MIGIRYVDRDIALNIPDKNIIFDLSPLDMPPAADLGRKLQEALAAPIGAPPLHEIVQPGQKVTLIIDDNTRITPTMQIVPVVLDTLNRIGIPDSDIQAVIASGTHRPMTAEEKDEKYGDPILSRIPVLNHNYKDPAKLVDYGTTERGTRILVNKDVVEADFRLAIGNIIPHHPTGWSAGAKAVLPGVGGEETVAQMHFLGSREPSLGRVDTPMRREMEDFAGKIGLNFILNVILNREGELVDAVAGHFIQAHRVGVEISKQVYGLPIPELADLVISSTSPVDFDFYQADKGITSAEPATKPGGEIVLVSGCIEGISPAHPELADYVGKMTNDQVWKLIDAHKAPDPLTAAEAIVFNDIKDKMNITLATEGISPAVCQSMGFRHVWPGKLNEYIGQRLNESPDLKIGILRQSAEVLPILTLTAGRGRKEDG
ncbi:MAG: nickel-dependent lactate racemase [Chloroflexota bacterium]|nr:nickel-dependent lactate racemase [Chloroflexota bacterium]